jgi:hypothetical protein
MNRADRRKNRALAKLTFPPASAALRVERVLWQLATFYARMYQSEQPQPELNGDKLVFTTLLGLEQSGLAVRSTDPNGDITWKATAKCPGRDTCESDSFVTLSTLNLQ